MAIPQIPVCLGIAGSQSGDLQRAMILEKLKRLWQLGAQGSGGPSATLRRIEAETAGEANLAIFARTGDRFVVEAKEEAMLLVLGGTPIEEPVVSYGPFVMHTQEENRQAMQDYRSGRMGHLR